MTLFIIGQMMGFNVQLGRNLTNCIHASVFSVAVNFLFLWVTCANYFFQQMSCEMALATSFV